MVHHMHKVAIPQQKVFKKVVAMAVDETSCLISFLLLLLSLNLECPATTYGDNIITKSAVQ